YADYVAMDRSKLFLLISLGLFIWGMLYFLISPFVLIVLAFLRRKRAQKTATATKWNSVLTVSGAALAVNIALLIIRMLSKPMRTYSDMLVHFIANYVFTVISLISVVMVIIFLKKTSLSKWQKVGYVLTCISSILSIAWLIIWQMYS